MDEPAVYYANKYLWSRLVAEGVLSASDYYSPDLDINVIPIVPAQEVPQLSNHFDDKAYIVYDVTTGPGSVSTSDAWWIERDEVTYAIYAPSIHKINQIIRCMAKSFKRKDESAEAMQQFLGSNAQHWFHELCFEWGELTQYTKAEGGRQIGEAQVSYNYSLKSE